MARSCCGAQQSWWAAESSLHKPPALRPGDRVGIVAPASNIQRNQLERGCQAIRDLGFDPIYDNSILDHDLYFAGSVERRARELEGMFAREDVRAIVCARGGYGSNYLLPTFNLDVVATNPKILVGYSDVTTLLTHFLDRLKLVTFHGPMVAKDFVHEDGVHLGSWRAALLGEQSWSLDSSRTDSFRGIRDGEGFGILYGGCLSMLVASLGTPYEVQTEDTLLFLEDIAAKPFQIDRMLMQLKLGGKLDRVKGIVFGEMIDCVQSANQDYTLEEVVLRVLGNLDVPIAFGLRSGHVTQGNITLPLGVKGALKVQGKDAQLTILEPAVS